MFINIKLGWKHIFWCFIVIVLLGFAVHWWPGLFPPGSTIELISFLALILAFMGAVNYFLYLLNEGDIETKKKELENKLDEEITKAKLMLVDERFAIRAGANNSTASCFLYLYIYQHGNAFNTEYREKILETAIKYSRLAIKRIESIKDKTFYKEDEFSCLNNFCVGIAFKAALRKQYDGYNNDRKDVRDYLERIGESNNNIVYKATRALVLWIFAERKEDKDKAHDIIHDIRNPEIEEELKDVWKLVLGKRKLPCDVVRCKLALQKNKR